MKTDAITLNALAKLCGIDRGTAEKRLRRAGIETGRGCTFTLERALPALCTLGTDATPENIREQRLRNLRAKADLLELDRKQREQELVEMGEAEAMVRSTLLPIREMILSAPVVLAARVNPTDPEHARAQIQSWVDNGLKTIREGIA